MLKSTYAALLAGIIAMMPTINAIPYSSAATRRGNNVQSDPRNAALLKAVQSGNLTQVKALLDKGADPNANDGDGNSALLFAFVKLPIVKLLLDRGADPNAKLEQKGPQGDMAFPNGMTVLMEAIFVANPEMVQLLLDKGARLEAADANGWTALMWAATDQASLHAKSESGKRIAALLIARGARIEVADKSGMTPQMAAAHFLSEGVAQVLLDKGASVNAANKRGETPLMLAVLSASEPGRSLRQSMAVIKLLLDKGADANIKNSGGMSALRLAELSRQPEIVALLRTGKLPGAPARRLEPPKQALLQRAKSVLKTNGVPLDYRWLSNTRLLVLRQVPIGKIRGQDALGDIWFLHDLRTGAEKTTKRLKALSSEVALSPNRQWALFNTEEGERITWYAVALDHTAIVQRHVSEAFKERYLIAMMYQGEWGWMPDSRSWVWLPDTHADEYLHACVYNLKAPGLVRDVKVVFPKAADDPYASLLPTVLLGFLPNRHVLSISGIARQKASDHVDFFEFSINKLTTSARRFAVSLPVKAKAVPALSPQGDRLAWLLWVEDNTEDRLELWISRVDGSAMRPVGFLTVKPGTDESVLNTLQWLPDEKQVSFGYKDALWTVPVD